MPTLICVSSPNNKTISKENKVILEFAQKYALSNDYHPNNSCFPDDSCRPD